jgi:hypothetical protein
MLGRGTWSHDGRRRAISKYDSQSILNGPEEISSVNGSHRQCAIQRPRRLPAKLGVYQYRTRRRGAFRSHKGVMYMPVQGEECDGPFARGDGGTVQRSRNRKVYTPANLETMEISIRQERIAKVRFVVLFDMSCKVCAARSSEGWLTRKKGVARSARMRCLVREPG